MESESEVNLGRGVALTIKMGAALATASLGGVALGAAGAAGAVGATRLWIRTASAGCVYDAAEVPAREVALVLGAGLRSDGTPTPYLAARLDIAADLFRRGAVRAVLVSGDHRTAAHNEPGAMRDYLLGLGLPEECIACDHAGLDTYDSCYRARHVFGVTSTIVISQTYHLPRALAVARALGLDAVGVGDDSGRVSLDTWAAGEQRELFAGVKAAWDVLSCRQPQSESAVESC